MTRRRNRAAVESDRGQISSRLQAARLAFERSASPAARAAKPVLEARARALAQEPGGAEGAQDYLELVEFTVANERYGVQTAYVKEVCPLKELTPLPGAPDFVMGIIALRGRILSVIDIRRFFDLPSAGLTDLNRVIVLAKDGMEFGLLADELLGAQRLPAAALQPPLPTLAGIRAEYLKGVTADRLAVLAADRLLSDPEIVVKQ